MGLLKDLFKKKVDIDVSATKSLEEEYDELKQKYEKLENKYYSALNYADYYNQALKNIKDQRELILQLQDKIDVLQEELIAKNKIIQGMNNNNN